MYKLLFSFILAFLIGSASRLYAQTAPKLIRIVNAESLSFDRDRDNAQVLRGNVICEHEGTLLHCDTALVYQSPNRMVATGHILITKGDSIRVTGDKLEYDGVSRQALLRNNVKCIEKDMVLTTNFLTFDVRNSVASYYDGGKLVNKENVLESKAGHYHSSNKEAVFQHDVVLTNPDYVMKSDTLHYRLTNKTAYFFGPSMITSKSDYIYCENGWYDTEREKSQFSKNALLVTSQQRLKGDSLVYDRNAGTGMAFRNVSLVDTSKKSVIYGHYAVYRKIQGEAFVTGKPLYVRVLNNDSVFLAADTLYHRDLDSVNNFLAAYHHVRIYKKDMQAVCDSVTLSTKDSLMQMFNSPVLWSNRMQATGRQINVEMGKNSIRGFKIDGKAFLIQQVDSSHANRFQQLAGKVIRGQITGDTIRKVIVNGNAEILYYPMNKNKLVGLDKTTCSEIRLWFKEGEISRVTMSPATTGVVDPMSSVLPENTRLKGFVWLADKRPKSRTTLHQR